MDPHNMLGGGGNGIAPPPPPLPLPPSGGLEAAAGAPLPPSSYKSRAKQNKQNSSRDHQGMLRKAPNAPKRFKSSYICFFMAKQAEIKSELGDAANVTTISKRSAEIWKTLSVSERAHWDNVAAKDKQRYMLEKAAYTGPWQVPYKRPRKDPSAPKRPMSAFLYFSQGKRSGIKQKNPELKNTEVSRVLGEMWRNLSDKDRAPHIEKEREERRKYKIAMEAWRKEQESKQEAQRKARMEAMVETAGGVGGGGIVDHHAALLAASVAQQPQPHYNPDTSSAAMMAAGYLDGANLHSPSTIQASYPMPYAVPMGVPGGRPIILGPNGAPHQSNPGFAAGRGPPAAPSGAMQPLMEDIGGVGTTMNPSSQFHFNPGPPDQGDSTT